MRDKIEAIDKNYQTQFQSSFVMLKVKWRAILRVGIIILCTSLTCWRGWSCFEKYVTKPQTINLEIVESTPSRTPHVSFCVDNPFNATVLDQCGIQNYTSQWTSEICPDAEQVRKMVMIPSDTFFKIAIGAFRSPFIAENLNVTALPYTSEKCVALAFNKAYERVYFVLKDVYKVYIHALGEFSDVTVNGISIDPKVDIALDYEIVIKKPTENEPCNDDQKYLRDQCINDELYQESIRTIGCTTPFSFGSSKICQDPSKIALELYDKYKVQHNHTCPVSCAKTLMHFMEKKKNDKNEVRINFPKQIKLFTAYYSYELLSLCAEIGGYIGLLLGVSLLDCLTAWTQFYKQ